jgi:glycosyltransferase involved in cell wall biosynthesis
MNIGYIVTDLGLGGTQGFVELAAIELARRGNAVTVVGESRPHDRLARLREAGVTVLAFDAPAPLTVYAEQLRAAGVELVHLNVWQRPELVRLGRMTGAALVLSLHHVPPASDYSWTWRLLKPWMLADHLGGMLRAARFIDAHIGCCEASARGARHVLWPVGRGRVFALANAIPLPAEQTPDTVIAGPVHFLQVGSLIERKNPRATLRAFSAVQRQIPDAQLTFVGDGPLRSELADEARREAIAGVTFAGEILDPSPYYLRCNVMVLPSLSEGLPYTLIEAAARGLPLIATNVDGIPESAVDRHNALLVPPGNVAALSAAMQRLAQSPELRRSLGSAGRKRVEERFEIGRHAERMLGLYAEIAARKRREDHRPLAAVTERSAK